MALKAKQKAGGLIAGLVIALEILSYYQVLDGVLQKLRQHVGGRIVADAISSHALILILLTIAIIFFIQSWLEGRSENGHSAGVSVPSINVSPSFTNTNILNIPQSSAAQSNIRLDYATDNTNCNEEILVIRGKKSLRSRRLRIFLKNNSSVDACECLVYLLSLAPPGKPTDSMQTVLVWHNESPDDWFKPKTIICNGGSAYVDLCNVSINGEFEITGKTRNAGYHLYNDTGEYSMDLRIKGSNVDQTLTVKVRHDGTVDGLRFSAQ